jgi:uncharacterized SAM-binding protein YcdF (DUF218 family)
VEAVFWLKALAKALVLPPAGPILVALAGLLLLRRAPRAGRALAWIGFLSLFALSLPVVAWVLTKPFDRAPLDVEQARQAQAIVILGGGTRRRAPEYGGDTLGRLTLERVRYGARVARQTGLPILVSGGQLPDAQGTEAKLMREALAGEFGLDVRWSEDRSRNTHQNARLSARMLKAEGIERVVLVAHAIDMPRAVAEFGEAGIATIPAATGLPGPGRTGPFDFVPTVGALQASRDALYEMLANAVRAIAS